MTHRVSFPLNHDIERKFCFSSESLNLSMVTKKKETLEPSFQMIFLYDIDNITLENVDQL